MSQVSTARVLPSPSRAERKVTSTSKGHCIGFAVLGRGAAVRMQAESHLELNHLYLLNADPAIAHRSMRSKSWSPATAQRRQ